MIGLIREMLEGHRGSTKGALGLRLTGMTFEELWL